MFYHSKKSIRLLMLIVFKVSRMQTRIICKYKCVGSTPEPSEMFQSVSAATKQACKASM